MWSVANTYKIISLGESTTFELGDAPTLSCLLVWFMVCFSLDGLGRYSIMILKEAKLNFPCKAVVICEIYACIDEIYIVVAKTLRNIAFIHKSFLFINQTCQRCQEIFIHIIPEMT